MLLSLKRDANPANRRARLRWSRVSWPRQGLRLPAAFPGALRISLAMNVPTHCGATRKAKGVEPKVLRQPSVKGGHRLLCSCASPGGGSQLDVLQLFPNFTFVRSGSQALLSEATPRILMCACGGTAEGAG